MCTHVCVCVCFPAPGSDFLCNTHIIPVRNEEGVVMLFILNFDYVLERDSLESLQRLNHTSPAQPEHRESHTHTHAHTRTHTHTCTRIHTHTHTHTNTYSSLSKTHAS